ncbi:hypothetical protein [Mucilaginibacter antarcticus]|uniref:hypothetical protein n=1 Tax=Mucilaginibacter antarcticus TaxID=1855725 RepID=UPI00362A8F8D
MPLEGSSFTADDFESTFSHATEKVRPGYYEVMLDRYKIKAELTATKRVAYHRYTYTGGKEKNWRLILYTLAVAAVPGSLTKPAIT